MSAVYVVTDTYVVTTATNADSLIMSGHKSDLITCLKIEKRICLQSEQSR